MFPKPIPLGFTIFWGNLLVLDIFRQYTQNIDCLERNLQSLSPDVSLKARPKHSHLQHPHSASVTSTTTNTVMSSEDLRELLRLTNLRIEREHRSREKECRACEISDH